MTPEDRFWAKVDKSPSQGGCWEWTAGRDSRGRYGQFLFQGKQWRAHRFAWFITGHSLSDTDVLCHHCDNPGCVNPDHLYAGTQADNMRDMWARNRGHDGTKAERGERRYNAKLNDSAVRQIRERSARGETRAALAAEFDVSTRLIVLVVQRTAWKHVA